MSSVVQSMTNKVNNTPFMKKLFMQPPLFWLIIFTIVLFIMALVFAGDDGKENMAVITGLLGMTGLIIVAYKSSSFGYYGQCARVMKQFDSMEKKN